MKIIDLLNKIANGEEVHFKTKLNRKEVAVNYYNDRDFSSSTSNEMLTIADIIKSLNDEVEILEEEKKIPEKLQYNELLVCNDIDKLREYINEINKEHYFKINEIIDYLKSKGDE
jgi:hypothetical protein